ncbi:MAG: hypothetical protein NC453_20395 [Muribaculum sp.]|nr:hypothetical protein [Muribaculum sp.]
MEKLFKNFNLGINVSQSLRLALLPIFLMMFLMLSLASCADNEPEDSWRQTSTDIEIMNSLAEEGGCWQLIRIEDEVDGKWTVHHSFIDNSEYEYYWLTKERVEDLDGHGRTQYLVYTESTENDKTRFVKSLFRIQRKELSIIGLNGCFGNISTHTEDEMILEVDRYGKYYRYLLRKVNRKRPSGVEWEDWNDPARYDSTAL